MGRDAIREYDSFAHQIVRDRADFLEVEHGANERDCAGACVVHAHVHLIPTLGRYSDALDGVLDELYSGSVLSLPENNASYLFTRQSLDRTRVYSAADLPSQFLRQVICSSMGRADWDWRATPHDYLLKESIELWRSQLGLR